jgi:hypothetical protein
MGIALPSGETYTLLLDSVEVKGIPYISIDFTEDTLECNTWDSIGFGNDFWASWELDEVEVSFWIKFEDHIEETYDISTWLRDEPAIGVSFLFRQYDIAYFADSGTVDIAFPDTFDQATISFSNIHFTGFPTDDGIDRSFEVTTGSITAPIRVYCSLVADYSFCTWNNESAPYSSEFCIESTSGFPDSTCH